MKVIRAKTAGFCMGVSLALQKLDKALEKYSGRRILTLGPIIHNPQVLADYAERGVLCVQDASAASPGDCVIIRAHGIPRQTQDILIAGEALVVDATCPKVKKAQMAIDAATRKNMAQLLLFGEENHPEVRGLISYAAYGAHVFGSLEELRALPLEAHGRYVLASQTTQDRRIFDAVEQYLRSLSPDIPVLSTICDATRQRQEETMDIASHVEAMIVVGGRESGNTRRLADVAAVRGIPTFHVETARELAPEDIAGYAVVGLTAGASTPKNLIDAVQNLLESSDPAKDAAEPALAP